MTIVSPPKPGQLRLTGPARKSARPARPADTQAWFWKLHSPDAPANAARWEPALATLRARRAGGAGIATEPHLREIAERFDSQIADASSAHGVSQSLLLAVITVESAGRSRAVSSAGARGLMQLIPATAQRFGVADSFDPGQNIRGGAAYLDWLLKTFDEDVILALAGYNSGEGAVMKYRGVPPYTETRDYVVKVLDALAAIEALCTAPPNGPRQPCNWRPGLRS